MQLLNFPIEKSIVSDSINKCNSLHVRKPWEETKARQFKEVHICGNQQ
jgi:hypothetical protein